MTRPQGTSRTTARSNARPGTGRPTTGSGASSSRSTSRTRPRTRTDAGAPAPARAKELVRPVLGEIAPDNAFVALGVPAIFAQVLAGQGIVEPFPIQEATLADSLAGRDVLGQGRTGSGKTLAFAMPLVARLSAEPVKPMPGRPRALVVVPTRELATQVAAVIEPLAAAVGMRVTTIFGGVSHGPQRTALRQGVEIVVACPGRLLDHMKEQDIFLDRVEVTVLDEADHMADQGFLPMVKRIMDATDPKGQRMLFSATLAGGVDTIVKRYLTNPVSHAAAIEAPVLLDHHVHVVSDADRQAAIYELAQRGRVVMFTRTKSRAKQLTRKLETAGLAAVEMHGNLSQNARERNLAAFSDGSAKVLVATDIAARGIHVDDVPLVVHADPPIEHKAYTHRSGRTARAGSAGQVFTIATPDQVAEVRMLLKKAGVTAKWSGIAVAEHAAARPAVPRRSHNRNPHASRR
ncbi:MAG: DEAD/DEAH box helicase [Candidatus Nanopelagicales bacterium]|nr:DEAD/DEAH box helicase [Candidatus Nanopelagicales bacterium]